MISTLVLLGATGDLAGRYLFPALGALLDAGTLPEDFRVIGAARSDLDDDEIGRLAGDDFPTDRIAYRSVDLGDPASVGDLLDAADGAPLAVYLALPPSTFATTIESLSEAGMPSGSRVVIEKPFGDDAESAAALNARLEPFDAYRVDHVLGMETVRNLVEIRRSNPFLAGFWNGEHVAEAEVLWEETLALEGRAGFYDAAGALKDVLQNHMLQVLTLTAMEPDDDAGDLHTRKLDVLRAVRTGASRRARYTAGTLADGREVPDYADEEGVDPARETETFVEVGLELDNPRWRGTRWVLRTGKALSRRRQLVLLRFRDGGEIEIGIDGPNDLVLRLDRDGSEPVELRAPSPGEGRPAYAQVFLDILSGGSQRSVGAKEAEQSWRVVEPVLAEWEAGEVPLEEYPAGSDGP